MGQRPTGHADFWAEVWRVRLEKRGLDDFERLWRLELPYLDAANTTRGGISTVALLDAENPGQACSRLVIKRQHNHQSRTWRHPLQGMPTLRKEFLNIQQFDRCGLASVLPVMFAQRHDNRGIRAVLVTEYLEGYGSFDTILEQWAHTSTPPSESRDALLRSIADLIARMHRAGFRHNCLYPKHVFVNRQTPCPDVRLIDLEKAERIWCQDRRKIRDLSAFFRRSRFWSPLDQTRFLVHYHGGTHMTPEIERVWRRIQRNMARKSSVSI